MNEDIYDDEIIGEYGQLLFPDYDYSAKMIQEAINSDTDEIVLIQEDFYDEGDEYPTIEITDVLIKTKDSKYKNQKTTFDTIEQCVELEHQSVCPGCNTYFKTFNNKESLKEYIKKEYDDYDFKFSEIIDW